jgi:hypothetical protein
MDKFRNSVHGNGGNVAVKMSVADILERDLEDVIREWLFRVEQERELTAIPLNFEDRTGHLPQLLREVIVRLRLDDGTKAPISEAAAHHGDLRAQQGYTVAMAVEESRLLTGEHFYDPAQKREEFGFEHAPSRRCDDADEVDAQLKQQMRRFMAADTAKLDKSVQTTKIVKIA